MIASHLEVLLLRQTPRHPLVLAAEGFIFCILLSCVPPIKPAFFIAQAALCFCAHSVQLFSAPDVRVSVALYVILPQSHLHSHSRTRLFPLLAYLSKRSIFQCVAQSNRSVSYIRSFLCAREQGLIDYCFSDSELRNSPKIIFSAFFLAATASSKLL